MEQQMAGSTRSSPGIARRLGSSSPVTESGNGGGKEGGAFRKKD